MVWGEGVTFNHDDFLAAQRDEWDEEEMVEKRRAGDARTEEQRRARVVKGWAFMDLPEEKKAAIRAYLEGGPVPEGYEEAHEEIR